ncbi:MAG: TIGR04002 family protein [Ruminococcaceae bacterium]|nr:TIGR04002 family protein [Oscillospiraceae bacterium]
MTNKTRSVVMTAVFTAIIFVLTAILHIPAPSGYVHLGDAILYISAIILDMPWAIIAGALGEGLADVAGGFAMYLPATIIIKAVAALLFVSVRNRENRLLTKYTVFMTLPAAIVTVGGYFAADLLISREFAVADILGNTVQALSSAVIFIFLAAALDKINIKDKI